MQPAPHKGLGPVALSWQLAHQKFNWGRRWRKFEEKWKTLQEKGKIEEMFYLDPWGCEASYNSASVQGHNNMVIIKLKLWLAVGFEAKVVAELSSCPLLLELYFHYKRIAIHGYLHPFVCAWLWQVSAKERTCRVEGHEEVEASVLRRIWEAKCACYMFIFWLMCTIS